MNLNEYKRTGVIKLDQEDLDDPGTMEAVNNLMAEAQDNYVKHIQMTAEDMNVNEDYAMCIWYLRSRSRWTQELEDRLITMHNNGEPSPNMNEYGHD